MERNIIIENICTACRCGERRAEEYLTAELRNLRELRDAGALCYGDLETACSGLRLDFIYTEYFCQALSLNYRRFTINNLCLNRFTLRRDDAKARRKILRWLALNYRLYEYLPSEAEIRGRFISRKPFPAEAFRRQIGKLHGDRTLFLRIVSTDLYSLYVEGNVYLLGAWYRIFL